MLIIYYEKCCIFPPQHSSDTGTIKLRVCEPPVPIDSVNIHQTSTKHGKEVTDNMHCLPTRPFSPFTRCVHATATRWLAVSV